MAPKLPMTALKSNKNRTERTMKKTLSLVLVSAAFTVQAQNSNVVSAYNYLQDGDLAKAAEFIEPAISNEGTMMKEKTWRYRGDIYRLIALDPQHAALKPQFPDAMQKAVESYLKANELDAKGSYKTEIVQSLGALQGASLNAGNEAFEAKEYDKAIALYAQAEKIATTFGQKDIDAAFNSALAYDTKGDMEMAVKRYKECIEMGYPKEEVYRYLITAQEKQGDLDGAMKTAKDGVAKFPNSKGLVKDEVFLILKAGRPVEEALTSVNNAIATDPADPVLYMLRGSIYDELSNKKDGAGAPTEADRAKYVDMAEADYKKTIELDPKNFDANYNVGVLYNNRAAVITEKIKDIKSDTEYEKAKKSVDEVYFKALPYFERAYELRPDDKSTMEQLKRLYARNGNTAKYDEMKKKLGN